MSIESSGPRKDRKFDKIDDGGFVNVYNVAERFSTQKAAEYKEKGLVLKEYRRTEEGFGKYSLFEEEMIDDSDDLVHHLRKRHDFTKEFYNEMPDLVLRSRYFVGKGQDGKPTVYDLQKLLDDFRPVTGDIEIEGWPLGANLADLDAEEIEGKILEGLSEQQRKTLRDSIRAWSEGHSTGVEIIARCYDCGKA